MNSDAEEERPGSRQSEVTHISRGIWLIRDVAVHYPQCIPFFTDLDFNNKSIIKFKYTNDGGPVQMK